MEDKELDKRDRHRLYEANKSEIATTFIFMLILTSTFILVNGLEYLSIYWQTLLIGIEALVFISILFTVYRWKQLKAEIAKLRLAEKRLEKINYLYSVVTKANHIILHISGKEKLCEAICRLTVEEGGFAMAWIGFTDHHSKTIKPLAWFGINGREYLDGMQISLDAEPLALNPAAIAVLEKRQVINNDIIRTGLVWPNREKFIQMGYRSFSTFPIIQKNSAVGVFNVYASGANFFEAKEIDLLDELASDLAYALEALERDDLRKTAERELEGHRKNLEKLVRERTMGIEEMQRQLEFILTATKTGMDIIDSEYNMKYVDSGWQKIYGTPSGKKCYEYFMGRNVPCLECGVRKALETKQVAITEEVLPREGNRPIQVTTIPFQNEKGEWLVAEVNIDISERKKNEALLKDSEQKYKVVVDNIGIGVATISQKMEILTLNSQMKRWFPNIDLSRRPLCYMSFNNPPGSKPCHYCPTRKTLQDGLLHEAITETPNGDNIINYRIVSTPIKDKDGKVVAAIELVEDITERQKTHKMLRDSEERYRKITSTITDYIYTVRVEKGKVVETRYGAGCLTVTGYTEKEFASDPFLWLNMIVNDDRPAVKKWAEKILSGDKADPIEHRIIRKDGHVRWIENTPISRYNDAGELIAYDGVVRDITDKKRMEYERGRASSLESIIESTPDIIVICDLNGRIVKFNYALISTMGFDGEVLGKHVVEFVLEKDRQAVENSIKECMTKGVSRNIEASVVAKDGMEIPVLVSASLVKDMEGLPKNIIAVIKDITELKRAETAIIMEKEKAHKYLDLAGSMIMAMTPEGNITLINKKGCEILGYREEDVIGENWFDKFVPIRIRLEVIEVAKRLANGEVEPPAGYFENPIINKTGQERIITWHNVGLKDKDGRITGFLSSGEDITDMKNITESLRKALEVKTYFTSMVSHELRTPLGTIREGIAIVLEGIAGGLNEKQKNLLSRAKQSVDRLTRLINDLLDFQKLESGGMKFKPETNDISKLTNDIILSWIPLSKEKGLNILLKTDKNIPKIQFDTDRITQVISNLINNAIKFTHKGSIQITISKKDKTVEFLIKDTGIGIRSEDMPRLFRRFERFDQDSVKPTGGTGLGLAISKEIIARHGGNIWAESEYGKGTTFFFTLPIT